MVLAKGILKTLIKGVNKSKLIRTIIKTNSAPITQYYPKIPYNEGLTKASLLLEVGNARVARNLYDKGVIYKVVIYYAKPYLADLAL